MRKENLKFQFAYFNDDSGLLSIDFIIGLSIFLIAFMMVATMASGLLVGLQSKHVDYDAVAYRTAVMLTEDPGEPVQIVDFSAYTGNPEEQWEFVTSGEKEYVNRFGLAVSKSTPRVISLKKFNSFNNSFFSREDYEKKLLFSNYPYNFNVTIRKRDLIIPLTIGDPYIENQQCGYIRRVLLVKEPNPIIVDLNTVLLAGGEKMLTINISTPHLLLSSDGSTYRLDPYREDIKVRLEHIESIASDPNVGVSLTDVSCNISKSNDENTRYYAIDDVSFRTKIDGYYNNTPHNGLDDPNPAPTLPIDGIKTSIEFEIKALRDGRTRDIDKPKILIRCHFNPATVQEMTPYIEIDDSDYPGPNFVPGWMEVRVW